MHWQTLTHTHTRIHAPPWTWWDFSLGVIIWNRGEWSVSTMHVCVWKSRVEVWRAVSLLRWGRLSLMNPPGLRVLLLTAANFTWHCWAAAEHGLATNRHASVSIRKETFLVVTCTLTHRHEHFIPGQGCYQGSHIARPQGEHLILTRRKVFTESTSTWPLGAKDCSDFVVTSVTPEEEG